MGKIIIFFLLSGCSLITTNKQETLCFYKGADVCCKNNRKTICTIYNDPNDPVRVVDGMELTVEFKND